MTEVESYGEGVTNIGVNYGLSVRRTVSPVTPFPQHNYFNLPSFLLSPLPKKVTSGQPIFNLNWRTFWSSIEHKAFGPVPD